jgi:hypothetical protein
MQNFIQLMIKRMTRRYGQSARGCPQLFLSYPLSPSAHCHVILTSETLQITCFASDLHHELLEQIHARKRGHRP